MSSKEYIISYSQANGGGSWIIIIDCPTAPVVGVKRDLRDAIGFCHLRCPVRIEGADV